MDEKPRLGQINFVDSRELHRVLMDTNPDPTVVLDGDNIPFDLQQIYVSLLMRQRDLTSRVVVLTEKDPGELFEEQRRRVPAELPSDPPMANTGAKTDRRDREHRERVHAEHPTRSQGSA